MLSAQARVAHAPVPAIPKVTVTAFVDIAVIPMDSDRMLPHQTVVVRGDHIVALGPVSKVVVPSEAVRVDGAGKFLLPGLGDMHFHTTPTDSDKAARGVVQALSAGVTTARSMSGSPLHLLLRERAAHGAPSPRIYTAGPTLHSNDVTTTAQAIRTVAEQKAAGYDFMKIYSDDWKPEVFDTLVAAAARAHFPMSGHVPTEDSMGVKRAMAVPYRSMEHLHGYLQYLGSSTTDSTPIDPARLRWVAEETKRSGVWNTPTLHAVEDIRAYGIDLRLDVLEQLVLALHNAGAGLLLGTDVWWGSRCRLDANYHAPIRAELRLLVEAGLTPYQALETGTRNVAAFFGTLDSLGTIAVGKQADLVFLDSNPLMPTDSFAGLMRPAGVMVRGQWLPRATLEQQLASLATNCTDEP